ncbi:MAG: hypothetical protein ACTHK7_07860 [Aureliella sp.]
MPTTADEFHPPDDLVQSLLVYEVLPRLASFEADGCPPMFAKICIAVHAHMTHFGTYGSSGEISAQSNGELRIRMRKTGNENRVVWRIESLFPGIMTSTGFVGFDSQGDAKQHDGRWTVRSSGWIGKYNVDYWHGWT